MQNSVNETSIAAILEIDKKAREKVLKAKEEAQTLLKDAEQKKAQIMDDYTIRSDKRLDIVEKTYKSEADEKIAQIEAKKKKRMDDLSAKMEENKARWEKQILSEIVSE